MAQDAEGLFSWKGDEITEPPLGHGCPLIMNGLGIIHGQMSVYTTEGTKGGHVSLKYTVGIRTLPFHPMG